MAQASMTLGAVGIECQATLRFGNRLIVLLAPQVNPAEEHVGEREALVERHAFLRELQRVIERGLVVTPPVPPLRPTDFGKERMRRRERRIEPNRPFDARAGLCGALSRPPPKPLPRLQEQVVGFEIVRVAAFNAGPLTRGQVDLECGDDGSGDLVLEGEDVLEVAIVALRPEVKAGCGVGEGVAKNALVRLPRCNPSRHKPSRKT
jgi:hypothetical protein